MAHLPSEKNKRKKTEGIEATISKIRTGTRNRALSNRVIHELNRGNVTPTSPQPAIKSRKTLLSFSGIIKWIRKANAANMTKIAAVSALAEREGEKVSFQNKSVRQANAGARNRICDVSPKRTPHPIARSESQGETDRRESFCDNPQQKSPKQKT